MDRAGVFGEKPAPGEDKDFPIEDGHHEAESEESDEDFIKRTSREAKRKKVADDPDQAAAASGST